MRRAICFDVFGTSFSLEKASEALERAFSYELGEDAIQSNEVVFNWFYAAQRDFTYLSLASSYTPISQVFAQTLPRALLQSLPSLRAQSQSQSDVFIKRLQPIITSLRFLSPRPNLVRAVEKLRNEGGFECWAVTNGGKDSTRGLFERAGGGDGQWFGGVEGMADRIISCDEVGVAKPDSRVYHSAKTQILRQFRFNHNSLAEAALDSDIDLWFLAAHAWDLTAARKAGFKTAYVTYEEYTGCEGLFGEPDAKADDLMSLVEEILKKGKVEKKSLKAL